MGRFSKDRVQMSLYIDRDIAEELKREDNVSETVNDILRGAMDKIGMFGSEDVERSKRKYVRERMRRVIKDCVDDWCRELMESEEDD